MTLLEKYKGIRQRTEDICAPLQTEDYVVQPVADVSPPKWHIGHTTWFFETFLLKEHLKGYKEYNPDYNYVFNSYYETIGARVIRTDRGNLSRPGVKDVYRYRDYVDEAMEKFLSGTLSSQQIEILQLGLNHEQQHQELLCTDIKYILGHNPLFPSYSALPSASMAIAGEEEESDSTTSTLNSKKDFIQIDEGIYEIGYQGKDFCFDNELGRHKVYLHNFSICEVLISNKEYLEFITNGGYRDFRHWHADGWEWVKTQSINAPLYWHFVDGEWFNYTMRGLKPLLMGDPLCHVSYYEASAFASWKGMRLPTEFEWEIASNNFEWGKRWEWTESAYLPYPGFTKAPGAIGEYNGKFMINQMVLKGASEATSPGHSRHTYRNFFQPDLRWQFTGIRLVK